MVWNPVNFHADKIKISLKISLQMGLASIPTRDFASKKVNPADTFVRGLENFTVVHCFVFMQIGACLKLFILNFSGYREKFC